MRVLLSDGSGVTSRQVATRLAEEGHHVEALTPTTFCIDRFTRHVRQLHRVPRYGDDPFAWLDTALEVYRRGGFNLLFPTQEQVAVLSHQAARLRRLRVRVTGSRFRGALPGPGQGDRGRDAGPGGSAAACDGRAPRC